ncbi:MAG: Tryptophan synthase alpha chain, partial [uncultured Thermomicrobiales bacterium]
ERPRWGRGSADRPGVCRARAAGGLHALPDGRPPGHRDVARMHAGGGRLGRRPHRAGSAVLGPAGGRPRHPRRGHRGPRRRRDPGRRLRRVRVGGPPRSGDADGLRQHRPQRGDSGVPPAGRCRRRCRADHPRPAPRRGRGAHALLPGRGHRARPAGGADHAGGQDGGDRPRRAGLRLRGLPHRHHGGAGGPPAGAARHGGPGKGGYRRPGGGGVRHLDPGAGKLRRGPGRRGHRRQPGGPRRRRRRSRGCRRGRGRTRRGARL